MRLTEAGRETELRRAETKKETRKMRLTEAGRGTQRKRLKERQGR